MECVSLPFALYNNIILHLIFFHVMTNTLQIQYFDRSQKAFLFLIFHVEYFLVTNLNFSHQIFKRPSHVL